MQQNYVTFSTSPKILDCLNLLIDFGNILVTVLWIKAIALKIGGL